MYAISSLVFLSLSLPWMMCVMTVLSKDNSILSCQFLLCPTPRTFFWDSQTKWQAFHLDEVLFFSNIQCNCNSVSKSKGGKVFACKTDQWYRYITLRILNWSKLFCNMMIISFVLGSGVAPFWSAHQNCLNNCVLVALFFFPFSSSALDFS